MPNVDVVYGAISVSEILFNTNPGYNRGAGASISGMMFVSGANLMININGGVKTVTVT